jgi:hypothetical protein
MEIFTRLPMKILLLISIIIAFSFWDYLSIINSGNLKGFKKAYHIALLWISLGLTIYLMHRDHHLIGLHYVPFTLFLTWLIKDATMGWLLKRDIFYLGSGKWDEEWKKCPPPVLLGIKLFWLLVTSGLLFY